LSAWQTVSVAAVDPPNVLEQGWGLSVYVGKVSSTGTATTLPMSEDEKRDAGEKAKPPLGFSFVELPPQP
jgi:hypothetical protein